MYNLAIPKLLVTAGAFAVIGAVFQCSSVQAIVLTRTLYNFTGDTAAGVITIEDLAQGEVRLTTQITSPTVNGDIAGVWFGVKDTSLLSSLSISDVTTNIGDTLASLLTSTTGCPSSGHNKLNGGADGSKPCDSGLLNALVSFGKAGSSTGLVQTASFVIKSGTDTSFSVASFNDAFGLRYQSTGSDREGSSKLCSYPGYMGTTSSTFDCSKGVPPGAVEEPTPDSGGNKGKGKNK